MPARGSGLVEKPIVSSRKIAQCCRENVLFMALSANSGPHFTTIADFVATLDQEIILLFRDVLLVCYKQAGTKTNFTGRILIRILKQGKTCLKIGFFYKLVGSKKATIWTGHSLEWGLE